MRNGRVDAGATYAALRGKEGASSRRDGASSGLSFFANPPMLEGRHVTDALLRMKAAMSPSRLPLRRSALIVAVLAAVPYVVFKLLWLSGSTLGMTEEDAATEMGGTRFVIGNVITLVLMALAGIFALGLTRPWGRRVPAWLVLVLGAGATGLLAPILLGLPLGVLLQAAVATENPAVSGLEPWVFGFIYGGFGVLAMALTILLASYVQDRWGRLLRTPPPAPSWPATFAGATGLLPFGGAAMLWGLVGPGRIGPQGMELPAQRTVLLVTGVLAVAAFVVTLVPEQVRRWPRSAWLVTWTGCCTTALQGPTQLLLAQEGKFQPTVALIALLATPGSSVYGLSVLARQVATVDGKAPRRVHRARPAGAAGL